MTLASPFMARAPVLEAAGSVRAAVGNRACSSEVGAGHQAGTLACKSGRCALWFEGVRMTGAIRRAGGQRLVHDAADGARAPPALRAATEAAIDLIGRGRPRRRTIEGGPHVAVAQNIAGTNDHTKL